MNVHTGSWGSEIEDVMGWARREGEMEVLYRD